MANHGMEPIKDGMEKEADKCQRIIQDLKGLMRN